MHWQECKVDPSGNKTYECPFDTVRPYYRLNMSNLGSNIVGSRKIENYAKEDGDDLATWFQNLQLLLTDPEYDCFVRELWWDCGEYCERRRSDEDCFDDCIALHRAYE